MVARGVTYFSAPLGHGSSGDAEWLALLYAVEVATSLGAADIILIGDSRMVIDPASGRARPARNFRQHCEAYRAATLVFTRVRLRHIPRTQNLAGIALDMRRWR